MPSTATSILDGLSTSVAVKAPCRTVATSNITLAGLQTLSGYTTVENDRVLVKGQTNAADNGIYMASTGTWTRAKDADGARDLVQGTRVIVRSTTIDGVEYELITANPITIGTTSLTFELRYGANATYDQTEAEIAAGVTPTVETVEPYNALRYGATGDGTTDDTLALQRWLNACAGRAGILPAGTYIISAQLEGGDRTVIRGEGRDKSILRFEGSTTISGGAMLKFENKAGVRVSDIGFRVGEVVAGNGSIMLHLEDCFYWEVANVSCGGDEGTSGSNRLVGLKADQTASGFVPPVGNGTIRNFLYVIEPTDSGGAGSVGVWIRGHASQKLNHIVFEGEGGVEHAQFDIKLENCSNCVVGKGWQVRGSTDTEIRMLNADNCIIMGPQIVPPPAASVPASTGIYLDSNCIDNIIIDPAFNFTSGAPFRGIDDNGSRTSVIHPGAPGFGIDIQGKLNGSYIFSKPDGIGPNIRIHRTGTDTAQSGLEIVAGTATAMVAKAFIGVNKGSSFGTQDIERFESDTTLYERLDTNGQRYLKCPNATPGNGQLAASQLMFYVDEVAHNLIIVVKYANGATVRAATIAIV